MDEASSLRLRAAIAAFGEPDPRHPLPYAWPGDEPLARLGEAAFAALADRGRVPADRGRTNALAIALVASGAKPATTVGADPATAESLIAATRGLLVARLARLREPGRPPRVTLAIAARPAAMAAVQRAWETPKGPAHDAAMGRALGYAGADVAAYWMHHFGRFPTAADAWRQWRRDEAILAARWRDGSFRREFTPLEPGSGLGL